MYALAASLANVSRWIAMAPPTSRWEEAGGICRVIVWPLHGALRLS
jgi:hypothetical protein